MKLGSVGRGRIGRVGRETKFFEVCDWCCSLPAAFRRGEQVFVGFTLTTRALNKCSIQGRVVVDGGACPSVVGGGLSTSFQLFGISVGQNATKLVLLKLP